MKPWIVLVGGFLGSGKTTLILAAARLLQSRGVRAAVVLNDQGTDLVDTAFAKSSGVAAGEVTGGCFCCRYGDLSDEVGKLEGFDVIFAEPVGSCTDIAATVIQRLHAGEFRVAPYTVLVDPTREITDPNMEFLFRNQIAEADLVCSTKSDIAWDAAGAYRRISAKTGQGVAEWIDEVLAGELTPGAHLLDLDYARYAEAEMALSWLDVRCTVQLDSPLSPAMVAGPLLDKLDASLDAVHMKVIDRTAGGYVKAAIVGKGSRPDVDGDLAASPDFRHELLLNIRSLDNPGKLERTVRDALPATIDLRLKCFRPNAPVRPAPSYHPQP